MGLGGREKGRSGLVLDFVERAKRERERERSWEAKLSLCRDSLRGKCLFFWG